MKLPEQVISRMDPEMQKMVREKAQARTSTDYLAQLQLGDKNLKEKTRNVLWSIYQREGYLKFMQVVGNMQTFKNRNFNDLVQVKGEIAEVILEIIIHQFIKERKIEDWNICRGLILGNKKNKSFSTEIDMILITPMVVTIIEVKSYNGNKVLSENCTLTATNGKQVLEKDIFRQNSVHIQAYWDNFQNHANSSTGAVKSVLFSFSKGNIIDRRDKSKIAIMPVYTEVSIPGYLQAVLSLNREPIWNMPELLEAIKKVQKESRSAEDHVKYVKSLHKD